MTQTILHLGAGPLMVHSIEQLRAAGFVVHALDRDPTAPGLALADHGAAIDFSDIEAVADHAEGTDAALLLGVNEPGVWTASVVSARLGLPNITPDVAWRCLHKGRMRQAWCAAGLCQPAFEVVSGPDGVASAVERLGFPCVLKPTFGWGSNGVSVLRGARDLDAALAFAAAYHRAVAPESLALLQAPSGDDASPLIVERFVDGLEVTVEALVQDGELSVLGISDKAHQAHSSFRVAMALYYPADLTPETGSAVVRTVSEAARALGHDRGAVHAECIIDAAGDVHLVELGARGGGGHIFGLVAERASGVGMPVALARLLLGQPVDIHARVRRGVCYRFFAPPPGRFLGLEGMDAARATDGVETIGFSMAPGTDFDAVATDASRPGFLVTVGYDRAEAAARAEAALSHLRFNVEPATTSMSKA